MFRANKGNFIFFVFLFVSLIFSSGICYGNNRPSVVATIFPLYDWVRELSKGTDYDVELLLDKSIDLHSYQPSVDDIIKVSKCDFFIYVGGESDEWVENILKDVTNKNQIAINLLDVLDSAVKTEEHIEGMQHEHHDHEEDEEVDEHVWLSIRNAETICRYISEKLSEFNPEQKEIYSENLSNYLEKLSELDKKFYDTVNSSKRKVLLFADRFPFRYFVDDYGLKYFAAFSGCSAETEASFETVVFLSKKVDELNLPCVFTIEGRRHKIPETVIANTRTKDQKILELNSMQSITETGESYLSIMGKNLEVLKEALN